MVRKTTVFFFLESDWFKIWIMFKKWVKYKKIRKPEEFLLSFSSWHKRALMGVEFYTLSFCAV